MSDTQGAGYGELVEKLRIHHGDPKPTVSVLYDAATAIQTLTAENERLEAKLARAEQDREQARAEAIEPLVGAIDAAMTDLDLLRRAIEGRDPWAELLIRTTDTWRRLDVAIRSLSAAQGEGARGA